MVYIISTLLRKAFENHKEIANSHAPEDLWKSLMLGPHDYGSDAVNNEVTRQLMTKIEFEHGGEKYDS